MEYPLINFLFVSMFHLGLLSGGPKDYIKHFNGSHELWYTILMRLFSAFGLISLIIFLFNL